MAQYRKDRHQFLNDGKTIFEVVSLSDRLTPSGTATDAFGRLRVSNPFTLFDSQNRYKINDKFNTANSGSSSANTNYNADQSAIDLRVGTNSTDTVKQETKRVFAYQPGKSLLIMNTFAMANAQANLTQRVGYFNDDNGIFLEKSNSTTYLVLRSKSSGSVVETKVAQSNWNVDKFDGLSNSYSASIGHGGLDTTKTNIFWIDIEWLGVGDVRCGFVVDGLMVPAHIFHNDNLNTSPYMTTACLPIRYEIFNTGTTTSNSVLKQICSTVISEGGYELIGKPRTIGIEPVGANTVQCTTAGTYYPVVSIRLNDSNLDGIVVPKHIEILPITAANYKWKIVQGATITGAVWANVASDSIVQYNTNTAATMSGGSDLNAGYVSSTVQGGGSLTMTDGIFNYQLERNSFTNTATTWTLAVASGTNTSNVAGQIIWEEVV